MTAIRSLIKRHPVLTYYARVFAISWGGILVVVGPGGFPATEEESEALFPLVLLVLFAGPSAAGLACLSGVYGVGVRPHGEPACGDAHACEFLSQPADPPASGAGIYPA